MICSNYCTALAFASLVSPSSNQMGSAERNSVSISTSISLPASAVVGSRRAGNLCFPNGSLRVSDFVRSTTEFDEMAQSAFSRRSSFQAGRALLNHGAIVITLKSMGARMCAKGYGLWGTGDRQSLSGNVSFQFGWSYTPTSSTPRTGSRTIEIKLSGKEARSTETILPQALEILAETIANETS